MTAETTGWFWHIHHNHLVEWSGDINERIEYIESQKPENEIKLRFRLLKRVKDQGAMESARDTYDEAVASAWKTYDEAVKRLHKKECPGCPWDGETIFPKKARE